MKSELLWYLLSPLSLSVTKNAPWCLASYCSVLLVLNVIS